MLFGPFDLPIVIGDPRGAVSSWTRRPGPVAARDTVTTAYERVLRQRNRLLKEWEGTGAPAGLETLGRGAGAAGAALIAPAVRGGGAARTAGGGGVLAVAGYELDRAVRSRTWQPQGDVEATYRARLAERRADELQRRTSLVGPHRDELELAVRDLGARSLRLAW